MILPSGTQFLLDQLNAKCNFFSFFTYWLLISVLGHSRILMLDLAHFRPSEFIGTFLGGKMWVKFGGFVGEGE